MLSTSDLADSEKLVYRITRALQKGNLISFLIGSGVTMKWHSYSGVPSASEIVNLIASRFKESGGGEMFAREVVLPNETGATAYQRAMRLLVQCEGQNALNEVISTAVLHAHENKDSGISSQELETLEFGVKGWTINPALTALAQLYKNFEKQIGPILTSNFDPLISIAVKKAGAQIPVVTLSEDSALSLLRNNAARREVIHFHGYWRGTDTLHTTEQITKKRPRFAGDLRKIINETTVVILGYGGWDDVFTETLFNIISEGAGETNILWAFHESDPAKIYKSNPRLLEQLHPQIGKRVILYGGVDANVLLPEITHNLATKGFAPVRPEPISDEKKKRPYLTESQDPGCDSPPSIEYWTGRAAELTVLTSTAHKVLFLTGIGGLGKSSLAAEFIKISSDKFDLWDWRDCREESNRMHTNLANICCRLSKGVTTPLELKSFDEDQLIEMLFDLLEKARVLFVFDNIDEYIDLTTFHPDRSVKKIVHAALSRQHNSKFIFTCRPRIDLVAARMIELPLSDFTIDETLWLFSKYDIRADASELKGLARRARDITNGHPFWINIIAAQAAQGAQSASSFMDAIEQSESTAIGTQSDNLARQTLDEVWTRLNDKQRTLLCGLAEAVCQQTEEELVAIMAKRLNYNALNKSLKKLRQLNLIVTKPGLTSADGYDLHPLVRRYVRSKFPHEQRQAYMTLFISYFDTMISKLRSTLGSRPSLLDLSNWSHKIELEINRHEPESALKTLGEVANAMVERGYTEEYIRLSHLVLSKLDWQHCIDTNVPSFSIQVCYFSKALVHLGRHHEADEALQRLENTLTSSGIDHLRLLDTFTYRYWVTDDFDQAIGYGRQAQVLKNKSGADIELDVTQNLALALRDSRRPTEVEEALKLFLKGNDLGLVLSEPADSSKHSMPYFGNVGRCLQFVGRNKEAFECYKKAVILAGNKTDVSTARNKGYAYWWISELFAQEKEWIPFGHFNLGAQIYWKKTNPPQERKLIDIFDMQATSTPSITMLKQKTELEIITYCELRLGRAFT